QKTKKAAMISVPRDIWVQISPAGGGGEFSKLNTAYAIGVDDQTYPNKKAQFSGPAGGGNLASSIVGSMLGLRIDYWIAVDFQAFKTMVDSLGGVDVNVDTTFTDYYYPRNDDPTIDASWMTIHFDAGLQHMDGEKAIEYARSRHSLEDGTDFGRSKRQQKLVLAIKDKALSPQGMTKAFGLMDALSKDFKTNLTIGQIRALADLARGFDPAAIERVSIDNTNFLADAVTTDGQDVLVPQTRTWNALRGYISTVLMEQPAKDDSLRIQLVNGSGSTGSAGEATNLLNQLGFHTLPPGNPANLAPLPQTEVHDFSQGREAPTVSYLANLFSARVVTETPGTSDQADIQVILGRNYEFAATGVDSYDQTVRLADQLPSGADLQTPRAGVARPAPATAGYGTGGIYAVAPGAAATPGTATARVIAGGAPAPTGGATQVSVASAVAAGASTASGSAAPSAVARASGAATGSSPRASASTAALPARSAAPASSVPAR
ncbi:MAG: LCP family protein, partial [Chloroflexi bacterium]|nr:LCP family protein [Chloroflexota bacterium]